MKVIVNRSDFLNAFRLCCKVAPTRPERPVLGNIFMEVGETDLLLFADNGHSWISVSTSYIDFDRLGSVLLPKTRVLGILGNHKDDTLTISSELRDNVAIRTTYASYLLNTMDPESFPRPFTDIGRSINHIIDAQKLVSMVKMTSFVADPKDSRRAMGGIFVESGFDEEGEPKLIFVATDGQRLSRAMDSCGIEVDRVKGEMQARGTISIGFTDLMLDCLRGVEGPVELRIGASSSVLKAGKVTISSQLISGTIPPYKKALEKRDGITIPLNSGVFRRVVEQSNTMTDDINSRAVHFRFSSFEVLLQAGTETGGYSEVKFPIDIEIDPIEIAINPKYIIQALSAIGNDAEVFLDLSGGLDPAVIRVDGRGYTYVVMPMSQSNVPSNRKKK